MLSPSSPRSLARCRATFLLASLLALAPGCFVPKDARPEVDLGLHAMTHFVHRGMTNNEHGVVQGNLAVGVPTDEEGKGNLSFTAMGNVDLDDDTGDAWFPDGNGGHVTQTDLGVRWTYTLEDVRLTVGTLSYVLADGDQFRFSPALEARGPTTEFFVRASTDVAGFTPAVTLHYDWDEIDGFYGEADVSRTFELVRDDEEDRTLLSARANVGLAYSDRNQSAWNYGLQKGGLADLRGGIELGYAFDERTTLVLAVRGSSILDNQLRGWFDVIGIDPDVAWASLGIRFRL